MFLGLDLGTSGLKALLVDEAGVVVDAADAPLQVNHPRAGWSEQDPADWVAAAKRALGDLARSNRDAIAAVRGIGLSGQMHGATLLAQDGRVLRPCILWNDTRSHAQAAVLDAMPDVRSLSGNIVFPGFTAPKLAWVKKHSLDLD